MLSKPAPACVDTGRSETRRRDWLTQLRGADNDLSLDQHTIEVDFDAVTRIEPPHLIERDRR